MKEKITQLEMVALNLVVDNDGLLEDELVKGISAVYERKLNNSDYQKIKKNLGDVLEYTWGRVYLK